MDGSSIVNGSGGGDYGRERDGRGPRRRWNDVDQPRRSPATLSYYAEYLRESSAPTASTKQTRRMSLPLHGNTSTTSTSSEATMASTIRSVTPHRDLMDDDDTPILPERRTTSFEEAFLPRARPSPMILGTTTTTIVGGPASLSGPAVPGVRSSKHTRRLQKERDSRNATPNGHNNGVGHGSISSGVLARSASSHRGHPNGIRGRIHGNVYEGDAYNVSSRHRPKPIHVDEWRQEQSPPRALKSSRNRVGSVNMPNSGMEFLASVPAAMSPPPAPSVSSLSSPMHSPNDTSDRRSISPPSSANNSMTSKSSASRRILHLRDVLKGRMSGHVLLRRDRDKAWTPLYCYILEETGRLMYEARGGDGADRALVSALGGCFVSPNVETDPPYLELTLPNMPTELHFKLATQADFDSWFAALLWWQHQEAPSLQSNGVRPPSTSTASQTTRPEAITRRSSTVDRRERAVSETERRHSTNPPKEKEAPVIKIGKMIFWDTNVGFSTTPGTHASGRPAKYQMMQGQGSRRWRRISGQLRENGELKLHTDPDNSLLSVVQLSQLSREAIQRLDPSVLENDFCLAIYPQYTSGVSSQPGFVRPIFLSLESRVLYEVWFVLLRAFTIPQLYGPPAHAIPSDTLDADASDDKLVSTTADMFRMERTLHFRVIEAKIYPPTASTHSLDCGFTSNRSQHTSQPKTDNCGYYAEVLLDDESRGKTSLKYDGGYTPFWGESFEFLDLPAVLSSISVVIKRRPPESGQAREHNDTKVVPDAYGFSSDQQGGYTASTFDITCGKVDVTLLEIEGDKELEKWWPIVNMYNQRIGEVSLKTRMNEGVILMQDDYAPLSELLHRFTNGLTLQVAQMVPGELKHVSDCFLNIFQVSGKVGEWLMALVEEEIDGIHKETPITRLRYSNRVGSDATVEGLGTSQATADRELIVRDLNKNATLEANLLFRGNTLLTKSLDTHMRRVGKEYLEEALAAKIKEIGEKDPECEVDPNRITSSMDLDRNWKRLLYYTKEVWQSIVATKHKCPVELRMIFRHIRACADGRYGDFLRSVSYSSVSGFLFLRFFCPAILNPTLFGILKDVKPRTRRTLTLIAKSLQTMANMASFGAKETWMEPMNAFLHSNKESFKSLIDDVCYEPVPVSGPSFSNASHVSLPAYPAGMVSAETHLSYTTPMTIMQRLPPTSREGFPSLPYLIDQARAFSELVQIWLDATSEPASPAAHISSTKSHAEVLAAINASEGELVAFHEICTSLSKRTQECLNRAERADRPSSELSFQLEELIDQLHPDSSDDATPQTSALDVSDRVLADPMVTSPLSAPPSLSREWDVVPDMDDEEEEEGDRSLASRFFSSTPSMSSQTASHKERPGSSGVVSSLRDSLRRAKLPSRGSDYDSTTRSKPASASASISNVSTDTDHSAGTTALPNYEKERRHRERRDAAKLQIKQEVEAARLRESQKERKRTKTPIVSALRRKKERDVARERDGGGDASREGFMSHG